MALGHASFRDGRPRFAVTRTARRSLVSVLSDILARRQRSRDGVSHTTTARARPGPGSCFSGARAAGAGPRRVGEDGVGGGRAHRADPRQALGARCRHARLRRRLRRPPLGVGREQQWRRRERLRLDRGRRRERGDRRDQGACARRRPAASSLRTLVLCFGFLSFLLASVRRFSWGEDARRTRFGGEPARAPPARSVGRGDGFSFPTHSAGLSRAPLLLSSAIVDLCHKGDGQGGGGGRARARRRRGPPSTASRARRGYAWWFIKTPGHPHAAHLSVARTIPLLTRHTTEEPPVFSLSTPLSRDSHTTTPVMVRSLVLDHRQARSTSRRASRARRRCSRSARARARPASSPSRTSCPPRCAARCCSRRGRARSPRGSRPTRATSSGATCPRARRRPRWGVVEFARREDGAALDRRRQTRRRRQTHRRRARVARGAIATGDKKKKRSWLGRGGATG